MYEARQDSNQGLYWYPSAASGPARRGRQVLGDLEMQMTMTQPFEWGDRLLRRISTLEDASQTNQGLE